MRSTPSPREPTRVRRPRQGRNGAADRGQSASRSAVRTNRPMAIPRKEAKTGAPRPRLWPRATIDARRRSAPTPNRSRSRRRIRRAKSAEGKPAVRPSGGPAAEPARRPACTATTSSGYGQARQQFGLTNPHRSRTREDRLNVGWDASKNPKALDAAWLEPRLDTGSSRGDACQEGIANSPA